MEQLDRVLARGESLCVSVRRNESDWLCVCHVVVDCAIKTAVLGVVVDGTVWEAHMIANVVPALLSLQHAGNIKMYSTESATRIRYALAASTGVTDPLVIGDVGQVSLLDLVRKQFLAEFGGLDPLSVLDYLRVRLASLVQESFLDRLPKLRRVIIFVTCFADVVSKTSYRFFVFFLNVVVL